MLGQGTTMPCAPPVSGSTDPPTREPQSGEQLNNRYLVAAEPIEQLPPEKAHQCFLGIAQECAKGRLPETPAKEAHRTLSGKLEPAGGAVFHSVAGEIKGGHYIGL